MSIGFDDMIAKVRKKRQSSGYVPKGELSVVKLPEDKIELVEYLVQRNGGDSEGLQFSHGASWDDRRLAIATDPEYTDRCRNHPYFQSLLGKTYRGKVFQ